MVNNKTYCPDCCKEINLNDLLIGIGGCIYCPTNKPFKTKQYMKDYYNKNKDIIKKRSARFKKNNPNKIWDIINK